MVSNVWLQQGKGTLPWYLTLSIEVLGISGRAKAFNMRLDGSCTVILMMNDLMNDLVSQCELGTERNQV